MLYNFDEMIDRRGTASLKWEVAEHELPMWVADMDFQTAPQIIQALKQRVNHGIFGYTDVTPEWYEAYINWWKGRHHFTIEKEWLIFCTGVVPAISSLVRKLTTPGENILVQTPVYNIFFNSIRNNGRNILENRLKYNGTEYTIDWDDLEEKLSNPQTTMMILCNPHNPVGKIWDRETLWRIGELCNKYHVIVISDEIHCDLTEPGTEYVPFASVSDVCKRNSITCMAPTKAFNLAGIQTAAVMAADETLRHKAERALNGDEVAEPNAFALTAAITAFTEGEDWLDALREYLFENRRHACAFIKKKIPEITPVPATATYLMWLDCNKISGEFSELSHFIRKDQGLYLCDGSEYGPNGKGFLRMNIACPRKRLEDGLSRLAESLSSYKKQVSLCRLF